MPTAQQQLLVSRIAAVVALLFLVPAALNSRMPYLYFLNLRWVVFLAFGLIAVLRHQEKPILVGSVIGAILFNPLIPLHPGRDVWQVLDWAAMVGFGLTLLRSSAK